MESVHLNKKNNTYHYNKRLYSNPQSKYTYLKDNLIVWCWCPPHPQGKFARVSFNMFCDTQLWGLDKKAVR